VPGAADDLRIEAYGSRGTLVFDTRNPNILEIGDVADGWQSIATLSRTQPTASLPNAETPTGVIQWHLASIAAFLQAIDTSTRPLPNLDDGVQVDRVIAAAMRSAEQGGVTITL
jgi:predicted dehydrogenase